MYVTGSRQSPLIPWPHYIKISLTLFINNKTNTGLNKSQGGRTDQGRITAGTTGQGQWSSVGLCCNDVLGQGSVDFANNLGCSSHMTLCAYSNTYVWFIHLTNWQLFIVNFLISQNSKRYPRLDRERLGPSTIFTVNPGLSSCKWDATLCRSDLSPVSYMCINLHVHL